MTHFPIRAITVRTQGPAGVEQFDTGSLFDATVWLAQRIPAETALALVTDAKRADILSSTVLLPSGGTVDVGIDIG